MSQKAIIVRKLSASGRNFSRRKWRRNFGFASRTHETFAWYCIIFNLFQCAFVHLKKLCFLHDEIVIILYTCRKFRPKCQVVSRIFCNNIEVFTWSIRNENWRNKKVVLKWWRHWFLSHSWNASLHEKNLDRYNH